MANAQHLHRLVQRQFGCSLLGLGQAAQAVHQVPAHIQVVKQGVVLKHHAQAPLPGGHKHALCIVLPQRMAQLHLALRALQPGQTAQQRGLARARCTPQHRHALQGQRHSGLQRKTGALQTQIKLQVNVLGTHAPCSCRRRCTRESIHKTANANTDIPPASTCAWA